MLNTCYSNARNVGLVGGVGSGVGIGITAGIMGVAALTGPIGIAFIVLAGACFSVAAYGQCKLSASRVSYQPSQEEEGGGYIAIQASSPQVVIRREYVAPDFKAETPKTPEQLKQEISNDILRDININGMDFQGHFVTLRDLRLRLEEANFDQWRQYVEDLINQLQDADATFSMRQRDLEAINEKFGELILLLHEQELEKQQAAELAQERENEAKREQDLQERGRLLAELEAQQFVQPREIVLPPPLHFPPEIDQEVPYVHSLQTPTTKKWQDLRVLTTFSLPPR